MVKTVFSKCFLATATMFPFYVWAVCAAPGCGRMELRGGLCLEHREIYARQGITKAAIKRGNASAEDSTTDTDMVAVKKILAVSGLPQLGRWIGIDGVSSEKHVGCMSRSIDERIAEYDKPFYVKCPTKTVTASGISRWKRKNIKWREYNDLNGNRFRRYYERLGKLVNQLARVAAECYQYDLSGGYGGAIVTINEMLSAKNYYKWESLSHGHSDAIRWFDVRLDSVEELLQTRLDMIDVVYKRQFSQWTVANASEYATRSASLQESLARYRQALLAQARHEAVMEATARVSAQNTRIISQQDDILIQQRNLQHELEQQSFEMERIKREAERQRFENEMRDLHQSLQQYP